ncbi:hypothetical protein Q361_1792 [Flavobacterium croceum DSM 17960]|uniref:Uncharacterized protein n=1 Tax=Flavobacterium croceum DSM 17960 TaxID=1121886 RepID=A0A2S4N447_9FLAO|nr:hypothetical protein [Flavobacterium croceum]POS00519.1 hypothetical protein Q361_1792 [Flavobacterium croceum DSM 17960]
MKLYSLIIIFIIFSFDGYSQIVNISRDSITNKLIDFLIKKDEIKSNQIEDYKNHKLNITFIGMLNGYSKNELIEGLYFFSKGASHSRVFGLIIQKSDFVILDLSNRESLNEAIKLVLDYCEQNKYCVEITKDYITKLLKTYYNINKSPYSPGDVNCRKRITDIKNLP